MIIKPLVAIPMCLFGVFVFWVTGTSGQIFILNLTESCFMCLCHVITKCDLNNGCTGGYCGPFNMSKVFWADAGRMVLPGDSPERTNAWQDCTKNYDCAKRSIEGYMLKYAQDCNGDGVTNCYDYMMIKGNGGNDCSAPLNRSANGRKWLRRYAEYAECQL